MVDFFEEPEERASGPTMQFGHHRVTVSTMRKGEPWVTESAKGPRLTLAIVDVDDRSQSTLDGQTFNGRSKGVIAGLNKALGFKAEQLNGLIPSADGITDTDFPKNYVMNIAAMWEGASAWVEISPNGTYKYPNVRFLQFEPKEKKGADNYSTDNVDSGGI